LFKLLTILLKFTYSGDLITQKNNIFSQNFEFGIGRILFTVIKSPLHFNVSLDNLTFAYLDI
ncbi:hypothetical protein BpHYR1_008767, partial [Brachionus plicatilis]